MSIIVGVSGLDTVSWVGSKRRVDDLNIASNNLIYKMKTYKVYLNIYDFMGGNRCLEALGVGAFHTGVEIG